MKPETAEPQCLEAVAPGKVFHHQAFGTLYIQGQEVDLARCAELPAEVRRKG